MAEVVHLNRIRDVTVLKRHVHGLQGYTAWLISGHNREDVQKAGNAIIATRGIRYASLTRPIRVNGQYEITGYTFDPIT